MKKINIIYVIFLFTLISKATSQTSHKEFEKKYLEFHKKWDNGYDATLTEIDSIFKDCPDLTRFPHYFLYKGDLLRHLGYGDLSIKYYVIAQKYIDLGYDSKHLEDHSPIVYFKLANAYFHLKIFDKMKNYIDLLEEYNQKKYSFHTEYDYKELLAMYWFYSDNKKEDAIHLLEEIYNKAGKHKKSPVYMIRNTALLKAINMSLQIKEYKKAERILKVIHKENSVVD